MGKVYNCSFLVFLFFSFVKSLPWLIKLKYERKHFHYYCYFALTCCHRYCCIWYLLKSVKWLATINPNHHSQLMVFQVLQLSKFDWLLSFQWVFLMQANQPKNQIYKVGIKLISKNIKKIKKITKLITALPGIWLKGLLR